MAAPATINRSRSALERIVDPVKPAGRAGLASAASRTAPGGAHIVPTVTSTETDRMIVCERLAAALGRRDYESVAACFAEDATLRSIVPPGLREDDGPTAIAERFRRWTGDHEDFVLTEIRVRPFADLVRMQWVVTGNDPALDHRRSTFEQTAYAEVDDAGLITRMRLACSGDRPA